jgi:DNA-binding NarL/FixJ family response regulator
MTPSYRLVVIDDHSQFRRALIATLERMPEFSVAGEAGDGMAAVDLIRRTCPDLVLLDVNMPELDGVAALEQIRRERADLPVVMLTVSRDTDVLLGAINAGAQGYLLKDAEPERLREVILRVLEGESFLAPEVTGSVFDAVRRLQSERGRGLLSERELEVLGCLRRRMTTSEIASELFVSENTVKTHVSHILEKLDARNRAEAIYKIDHLGLPERSGGT